MKQHNLIAAALAIGLGAGGVGYAQTTTTPPAQTTPPETLNGSTTMNNPATATTPPPGSPAAMSAPATAPSSAAARRTPPVAGANSFTEGEARSRIVRHGFSQVSHLTLDHAGIWRGQAQKGGKTMTVALDYRGNVVAK